MAIQRYHSNYPPFTDQNWSTLEREHRRRLHLVAGFNLVGQLLLETQDYQDVLDTCQCLLVGNPCMEAACQFESCQTSLLEEINAPPPDETRQLHQILMR